MKKLFLFIIAAFISLSLHTEIYSGYCGAEGDSTNLQWSLNTVDSTLAIIGSGAMADYGEPWLQDYSLYGAPWYEYSGNIKYLFLSNEISYISQSAFYSCNSLTSIEIPNSVTGIGAFSFHACRNLTSLTIPNSVTYIGHYAFSICDNLTSVSIPESVTSIGDYSFMGCRSLTSITISQSIMGIGFHAFDDCINLTTINVDAANQYYSSLDGVLFDKDQHIVMRYPAGKNESVYIIPNSVTSIDYYAFTGCSKLTSVTIPNSVEMIGVEAFASCSSLTSIQIPNSVTTIGDYAFLYCDQLEIISCMAEIPPELGGSVFETNRDTLYVPLGSQSTYENSDWAGFFNNIVGVNFGETEITDVEYTTAKILWKPDSIVEQYRIDVYTSDTLFAWFVVDSNETVLDHAYLAPIMRQNGSSYDLGSVPHCMPQDTTISGTDYYVISLSGLSAGTQYTYTITGYKSVPDETPGATPGTMVQEKVYYGSGSFQTKLLTALSEIWLDNHSKNGRCVYLIDGRIVILRDGMMYDLMGRRL